MPVSIVEAGPDQIDVIQSLWEGLNRHHGEISIHFKERFKRFTFDKRMEHLLCKAETGTLRIFMAMADDHPVGYCVASLDRHGMGEIESLFVDNAYRNQGAADRLMRRAMDWLDTMNAEAISISVVAGNEDVFGFYERYGFLPRATRLLRKT